VKFPKLVQIAFLGLLSTWGAVSAHDRSESTSHWTYEDGQLHGIITARVREVTRLTVPGDNPLSLAQIFADHVGKNVSASVDGKSCIALQPPSILEAENGYVRIDARFQCNVGELLTLQLGLFFAVAPAHHHYIYVESNSGASHEAILTVSSPSVDLNLNPSQTNNIHFLQFVEMGIEHIATGFDHLAFLLALLIVARTGRQVLMTVTGFTIGHSLTLTLAVIGVVQANRGAVECLIGLTIALAAAQNLLQGEREGRMGALGILVIISAVLLVPWEERPSMGATLVIPVALAASASLWLGSMLDAAVSIRSRSAMAMGFGLVHGLGFASALQDLHLPRQMLLSTIFGFNFGVEIGQLLAVAFAVVVLHAIVAVWPSVRRSTVPAVLVSSLSLALGITWFLTRAIARE
jgi:hypothetical protein